MLRVIDLDIEGTLTGDTRVEEIAMVEMPAIEQDFIYFSKQDFVESITDYPQYITDNAQKAKNWVDKNGYGSCMTDVGKQRLNQLANREPISMETIKRMKAYADRHKKDLQASTSFEDGCGMLAWYAWGLDESGKAEKWLESKINSIQQDMDYAPSLPEYVGYPSGDTKDNMLIKPVLFVERKPGEEKKAYVSRCTAYLIKNENYDPDQAYAICESKTEQKHSKGQKVSFDYDDTLNTARGRGLAMGEIRSGSDVYIISARGSKQGIYPLADELGIPHSKIFATGSNQMKVKKIKSLGITRHYDNNKDVIKQLGTIGQQFCFTCEPVEYNYSEEELEVKNLLTYLRRTDIQKFEAIVGSMRGRTADEVKKLNHKNPTNYFKYERVLSGSPDRDFCMSIEDRYFRRVEIDVLRDTNTEFGHEGGSYSKWLYKGGPNCVHAWRKFIAQGNVLADQGMAEGLAGMPPKEMPNNGYYSEETKRKSEVAYIVSQQMSQQTFKADTEKRMIYSPLMIPNMLIPRLDEVSNEKYYVKFTPQVIEKIQNLYMIEKRMDQTNYEHTNQKMSDVVMVESWLVTGKSDKAYQLGFNRDNIPDGTWMGGFKVLDTKEGDNIWNNFIKTGKVKGFSVEGNFITNFSRLKNDEYLLQEIINILNKIQD
jgi:hypothetical protein